MGESHLYTEKIHRRFIDSSTSYTLRVYIKCYIFIIQYPLQKQQTFLIAHLI